MGWAIAALREVPIILRAPGPNSAGRAMNIYEVIRHDHRRLLDVLASIVATPETDMELRKRLFSYFRTELVMHSKAEEDVFYSALKRSDLGRALVEESMNDHHALERLVMDVQTSSLRLDDWIGKLRTLYQVIETHIEKEESEVFTLAKQLFSAQDAEDLADRMLADKSHYVIENPVAIVSKKIREKISGS